MAIKIKIKLGDEEVEKIFLNARKTIDLLIRSDLIGHHLPKGVL